MSCQKIQAVKIQTPPKIDGDISDPIWDSVPWLDPGKTVFVFDEKEAKWWTFAGDNANRILCFIIKECLQLNAQYDSFSITIPYGLASSNIRSKLEELKRGYEEYDPGSINEELLNGLKFSRCLPIELGRQIINKRFVDQAIIKEIITGAYAVVEERAS